MACHACNKRPCLCEAAQSYWQHVGLLKLKIHDAANSTKAEHAWLTWHANTHSHQALFRHGCGILCMCCLSPTLLDLAQLQPGQVVQQLLKRHLRRQSGRSPVQSYFQPRVNYLL